MGLYFEILGLLPSLLINPYNYGVNKKTKFGSQKQVLWPACINCANATSVRSAIALHNSCQVVLIYLPQNMDMLSCSTQSKHAGARPPAALGLASTKEQILRPRPFFLLCNLFVEYQILV